MSSSEMKIDNPVGTRRRLTRQDRFRQLMDVAWCIVRDEGSDALTLGRLAEKAGVAKPVVYDHFSTRPGLLSALYLEHDARQTEAMDEAIATAEHTLDNVASIIASTYVNCVLAQGREIPGVIAALAGSPELEKMMRDAQGMFMEKCRGLLLPHAGPAGVRPAGLWAMVGAAEALSNAAAKGDIGADEAKAELVEMIKAMALR
ncbi:TetR/AcrR family transcriptional regulator [Rhizobium sp. XQZ8]|uniref:TetR/AcrR family transcriptional regulator n=1 Tax=Rhizobium populisoli TaxID=2859785 RepID=UPI001C669379|nr:TetR/AcrR family transcriptional regulator [Rhizobium populisoli]MBW6420892.1 TetR/AcrR family transcriptional regulator [Rhizobium populisoli]